MSDVTYYVALPFVVADDGVAAGEAVECFNPNAAVKRRRGAVPQAGSRRRGRLQPVWRSRDRRLRRCDRNPEVRRRPQRSERAVKPSRRVQLFKSNWMRSRSAIVSIISHRSASCGPSVMITTFQESSWGTTEMARSVGNSQMSSISSLIAASSSSRVFAGFFKRPSLFGARNGTTAFGYPCERMVEQRA